MSKTPEQLLDEAKHWNDTCISPESLAIAALLGAVRRQESRLAALERLHPTAGLPLEGVAPLPLERRDATRALSSVVSHADVALADSCISETLRAGWRALRDEAVGELKKWDKAGLPLEGTAPLPLERKGA